MPLTPEDVHKKTFTPVRLREGYDMGEVDQFLDVVEAELIRLREDNEELRARVDAVSAGSVSGRAQSEGSPPPAQPAQPAMSPVEASNRAARLLELAANNADQLVSEAREEADKLLSEARTTADQLADEVTSKAERLEADARTRSEKLDAETSERRHQLLGRLEEEKEELARALEDLRAYERDHRARLKTYFETQLQVLDGSSNGSGGLTALSDPETPGRLRELLGEETG